MAVEVLPGPVVAHGGAWIGVTSGDLNVAEADVGVEHGRDEGAAACTGASVACVRRRWRPGA